MKAALIGATVANRKNMPGAISMKNTTGYLGLNEGATSANRKSDMHNLR
jgi:hypothetical protein